MTIDELNNSFAQYRHRHVILTKTDGTEVEGYMQPWTDDEVPIVPISNATGSAIMVAITDIKSIEVKPLE